MVEFTYRQDQNQRSRSRNSTRLSKAASAPDHAVHPILRLQRTIGNQTVQRILGVLGPHTDVQPSEYLRTHPADDFSPTPLHPNLPPEKVQSRFALNEPKVRHLQQADRASDRTSGGNGELLPDAVRSYFEQRFNHNFSQVRVHRDPQAAASAKALDAKAYTLGSDIVFGSGQYMPDSSRGRHLLAHELAHVVQQNQGARPFQDTLLPVPTVQAAEVEASAVAGAISQGTPVRVTPGRLAPQLQKAPFGVGQDPIHQPIIEDYRRRRGLPLSGRDPFGGRVGPSAGQIKYQLSIPNQLARFAVMTPWQLSQQPQSGFAATGPQPPAWALSRFADYARAGRLAQSVFAHYRITFDVDGGPRVLGRLPSAAELAILNRSLSRILNLQNVRTLIGGSGGRGIPGGSRNPNIQGRVRIANNANEFGIKRYQLEIAVLGVGGQNQSQLDTAVRQVWQQFGITPGTSAIISDQERRIAVLVQAISASGNPGFYHPGDDVIYLEPNINLQAAAGRDVARHETVHLLGGRDQTRQAFVARYGRANYLPYWSTFEEGTAEFLARESRPQGQRAPTSTTSTTTSGSTTVTVTVGPGYDQEVRIMRNIMNNRQVGRQALLQAYFTGTIPAIVFQLLEQALGAP
jgi:hypothetical protein